MTRGPTRALSTVVVAAALAAAPISVDAKDACASGDAGYPACMRQFTVYVETPEGERAFSGTYLQAFVGALHYLQTEAQLPEEQRSSGVLALGRFEDMLQEHISEEFLGGWNVGCKWRWPPYCKIKVDF